MAKNMNDFNRPQPDDFKKKKKLVRDTLGINPKHLNKHRRHTDPKYVPPVDDDEEDDE